MYAVVKTGGKQYRVEKDDVVLVEKLNANDGLSQSHHVQYRLYLSLINPSYLVE